MSRWRAVGAVNVAWEEEGSVTMVPPVTEAVGSEVPTAQWEDIGTPEKASRVGTIAGRPQPAMDRTPTAESTIFL